MRLGCDPKYDPWLVFFFTGEGRMAIFRKYWKHDLDVGRGSDRDAGWLTSNVLLGSEGTRRLWRALPYNGNHQKPE